MDGEDLGLLEDVSVDEGSSGGDFGGEEEVTETPEETETEDEGGAGESESEEGAPGSEEAERPAARGLPTEVRRALRELNAQNPDFAKKYPRLEKQLTAALFRDQQYTRMGGMQQLRANQELLEQHGGAQAIAEMADEVQASRALEKDFQSGSPQLVDHWSKAYPDGFKSLVGPAIEKLESLDLAAHDRAISGPLYKTLDRCGVIGTAAALEAAIAGERWEDIQRHFGDLKQFLQELRTFAGRAKSPDPLKADREQLEQERSEIQTERAKAFQSGVAGEVNRQIMAQTNRLLRDALAGRKLQTSTANRVRKQINEDLVAAVRATPGYNDRYNQTMAGRDHDRAVNFVVKAAREKLPKVVQQVLRDFNLAGAKPRGEGGVRRPAGAGVRRSGGGGERVVSGRPKTSEIDFTRTDKAQYLTALGGHGQAWLKSGKLAKW